MSIRAEQPPSGIETQVALGPLTSFGVGGPAAYFARATSTRDVARWTRWAVNRGIDVSFLGAGTNVVAADEGFDGLVIRLDLRGMTWRDCGQTVLVNAFAGEEMDALCRRSVARGLAGIECLSGIPGTVGAAPIQNIGAYGQEIADVLEQVMVFDYRTGKMQGLSPTDCEFGYRTSRFKAGDAHGCAIVLASLRLTKRGIAPIRHRELGEKLAQFDAPTPSQVRDAVLALRAAKSMLLDPRDADSRGCGSFFINPVLSAEVYQQFAKRNPGPHPRFPEPDGRVKIPAAWLIEQSGFRRGDRRNGVGLSRKHVQAIINLGDATTQQLVTLVADIQTAVVRRFGVALTPEPVFLGGVWPDASNR